MGTTSVVPVKSSAVALRSSTRRGGVVHPVPLRNVEPLAVPLPRRAVLKVPLVIFDVGRFGMRAELNVPLVVLDAGRFGILPERTLPAELSNASSSPGKLACAQDSLDKPEMIVRCVELVVRIHAGFVATKSSMYVPVSSAIALYPIQSPRRSNLTRQTRLRPPTPRCRPDAW